MPNGGVPLHMILRPRDGTVVIYSKGGTLQVYSAEDWRRQKSAATPLCSLTESEVSALAWQLRYWLGEARLQPGYKMPRQSIDVEYDF